MNKTIIPIAVFSIALCAIYFVSTAWNQPNDKTQTSETSTITVSEISELQSLLKISESAERDRQLKLFFRRHIKTNPDSALEMISQLNRFEDRQVSYNVALQLWAELDFISFSNWLKRKDPEPDLDTALINLIQNNPSELKHSFLYAEKISDKHARNSELTELIANWALIDPEQTILWTITADQDRDAWLAQTFRVLTQNSLTSAITSLSFLETGATDQLYIAIQAIIDHYQLGQGNLEALAAMQSLTPYPIREELIGALLPVLVLEEDLSLDNLDSLLSSLLPGSTKDAYHEQIALNWTLKDPQEAASYAESLTGETRNLAVNAVVTSWMQNDLESTDAWLKTLDGNLDLAADTLGRGSASLGNIEIADTWLNYIENGDIRTEAITDVIRGWYDEDPKAGIYHLVYQENLSKQQKLNLLHEIYPGEVFISPNEALDDIGRLEGLTPAF